MYIDKQSGKDFNRPKYLIMIDKLQAGDTLCILSIDRLGRNYDEILSQWRLITTDKDVDIVVIDMPMLDTRGRHQDDLMGKVVADARAKGVRFGRPIKTPPENFATLVKK